MPQIYQDLKQAIKRLNEALSLQKTKISRDSAILRFQLCFDLAWKAIKVYIKAQGLDCYSPKSCFQTAFQLGLIEYEEKWLEMIEDRNRIAHTYAEETAERIYSRLKDYFKLLKDLSSKFFPATTPKN